MGKLTYWQYERAAFKRARSDTWVWIKAQYWEGIPLFIIGCVLYGLLKGWAAVMDQIVQTLCFGVGAVVIWVAIKFIWHTMRSPWLMHNELSASIPSAQATPLDLVPLMEAAGLLYGALSNETRARIRLLGSIVTPLAWCKQAIVQKCREGHGELWGCVQSGLPGEPIPRAELSYLNPQDDGSLKINGEDNPTYMNVMILREDVLRIQADYAD